MADNMECKETKTKEQQRACAIDFAKEGNVCIVCIHYPITGICANLNSCKYGKFVKDLQSCCHCST